MREYYEMEGDLWWMYLFTRLDYWTEIVDWTTGLTFDLALIKFNARSKVSPVVQSSK